MTKEEKQLFLVDLCARLPYGVKVSTPDDVFKYITRIKIDRNLIEVGDYMNDVYTISEIKPYLFPLSSMSEEQEYQYREVIASSLNHYEVYDWLNKNHFDYRNLINKNLAIDCTNLNIY